MVGHEMERVSWYSEDLDTLRDEFENGRWWRLTSRDKPEMFVRLGRTADGRLAVTGLMLVGTWRVPEITSQILRDVRFKELLAIFAKTPTPEASSPETHWIDDRFDQEVEESLESFEPRRRPGRAGHADEFYVAFSKAFSAAQRRAPRSPIKELRSQQNWRYSEAQIHRLKREAQRRGLLPSKEGSEE